ncbi:MAG: cytochrome C biogenesis protein [Candidatus Sungbacteria bacterium]|nr:cytochrome C biogenesis protein [Candidatus Sungbacteria bacterium]
MDQFSLVVAFTAGLVSFLSPCVLPIIPGFLAYLAGSSAGESAPKRKDIFLASLFFVLGFSAVFSLFGVLLNTVLRAAAYSVQLWLSRIGGGFIILFGLYLTGLLKFPLLEREYKFSVRRMPRSRLFTAFLFGAAFAAGWTPCVGAVLGSILGLAASAPGSAFVLLFAYSLGLGIPFLLVGFFTSRAASAISRILPFLLYIRIIFGILLIIIGIFAFTQSLGLIANVEILNRFLLQ